MLELERSISGNIRNIFWVTFFLVFLGGGGGGGGGGWGVRIFVFGHIIYFLLRKYKDTRNLSILAQENSVSHNIRNFFLGNFSLFLVLAWGRKCAK